MAATEAENTAWTRGYEAGLAGGNPKCPYDMGALWGQWTNGFTAGVLDRSVIAGARESERAA